MLRRVFGPKRDGVTGEWRKLHNEGHNIIWLLKQRRMRWVGHVALMGGRRGTYRVLVGKPEGKRLLGRPRHRWEDNIRWIFRMWDVGLWTGSSWLRTDRWRALVDALMNLWVT